MKILYIIDRLNTGGAERVCVTLATLFQQRGYDVTVLELLSSGILQQQLPPAVSAIQLNRKSRFDLMAVFRLVMHLRKYDMIHVHMRHVYRYVFFANLFARKKLIFHDHFNQYPTSWFQRTLFKLLLSNHVYISVEERGCEWAIQTLQLKADQVHKLQNVILKVEIDVTMRLNRLVLVSNIKPEKNIEFIVPLVYALNQNGNDVHIDIIGNIVDVKYYNSIVRQLKESKLVNKVSFLTNVSNVQNFLNSYSLGLHFSKRESGPLVLLEYLAQGLPFVSFQTGEISNNLQFDLPDFFVDSFCLKNWCDQIRKQLSIISYTPSLEDIFVKHNNSDQYFKKCLTIYQSIAS